MAMDALKNIASNVPGWVQKLDDLGGQIEQRQVELAMAPDNGARSIRSLRNRGSNESLKQKDDGDDKMALTSSPRSTTGPDAQPSPVQALSNNGVNAAVSNPPEPPKNASEASPTSPTASPNAVTSTEIKTQSRQAMTVAQARARAQVRKRHKSQSIVSIEGNPSAYRSRSMIIVYYDSFVQSFFEELVKFVSASRNLMRKAKMAAKVAQIKRLAEMDTPDDEENEDEDEIKLPSMRYVHSRRAGADFYDELDKALEYVQSMSERAAHQFLRDGDCNEEIGNISRKLSETKELAEKEMARIFKEEPELLTQCESPKSRMHRPPAVRRDLSLANKEQPLSPNRVFKEIKPAAAPSSPPATDMGGPIPAADGPMEVDRDEGFGEMEIDIKALRTTRMRLRGADKLPGAPPPAAPATEPAAPTNKAKLEASVPMAPQS